MFFGVMVFILIVTGVCIHFFDIDISEHMARMVIIYVTFRVGLNIGLQRTWESRYFKGVYDGIDKSLQVQKMFFLEIGHKELFGQFMKYAQEYYDHEAKKKDEEDEE